MAKNLMVFVLLVILVAAVMGARYGGVDPGFDGSRFVRPGYGGGGVDRGFDGSQFGRPGGYGNYGGNQGYGGYGRVYG